MAGVSGASSIPSPVNLKKSNFDLPKESPNFYHRCVQQLNLKEAKALATQETLWSTAAKIAPWVFGIIAIGTFIAIAALTGFNPLYMGLATLGILLTLEPVYQFCKSLEDKAVEPGVRAERLKQIARECDSLPKDAISLSYNVARMNVVWTKIPGVSKPEDLDRLRPLIGRQQYWVKETSKLNAKADELEEAANMTKTSSQKDSLREDALIVRQRALVTKINAAFVQSVILNPEYHYDNEDLIYEITESPYHKRELDRLFNEESADVLVKFHKEGVQALTVKDVRDLPIHKIAQRILEAA